MPAGPLIRPTRLEIDLDLGPSNAAVLRRIAGVPLYAVVKADGYGHGAVAVSRALDSSPDVAGFAVSLVEEGTQLRDAGIRRPILTICTKWTWSVQSICKDRSNATTSSSARMYSMAPST